MQKVKTRKVRLLKIEKVLYGSAIFCMGGLIVLKVLFGANIGNIKITIEELSYKLQQQEKYNESLVMKIDEITSYENIKDVVKDQGLAYNKDNIIVINN